MAPFFFENIKKNTQYDNLKIVRITYIYSLTLFIFSFLFGYFGKYLLYFMVNKNFFEASKFIFLISMAYFFSGVWKMFGGYLINAGKTGTYSFITFVAAVIHVVLNYYLLKKLGVIGSAWATFISMALGTILTICVSIKCHPMPWGYFWANLLKSNRKVSPII